MSHVTMLHNVTMLSFCHKEHFAMLHCNNDKVNAQCAIASFLSNCDDVTTRRKQGSNSLFSAIFPISPCASRVILSQLIHQNPYIVHDAVQHKIVQTFFVLGVDNVKSAAIMESCSQSKGYSSCQLSINC